MKWTGLGALACAVMLTMACGGDARDDRNDDDVDRSAAVGTSGADPSQSAAFDNDNDANDGAAIGTSGQTRTQAEQHGAGGDSRHFAQTIAMHNTAEIQLGQLAVERAQSAEVKQFAQQMIRDHTRAGNELKQAVTGENVDLTAGEMDQKHETLIARLRGLRGAEFDREYIKAMVEGHGEVRRLLEMRTGARHDARTTRGATPTGTTGTAPVGAAAKLDAAVNQWATTTLPTVQQHLQQAEQIHAKVVEGGGRR